MVDSELPDPLWHTCTNCGHLETNHAAVQSILAVWPPIVGRGRCQVWTPRLGEDGWDDELCPCQEFV